MSKFVEVMTVASSHSHPSPGNDSVIDSSAEDSNPIVALKELVANLQREQNKIQDLLSSLGFALRSFSNLNQFLELTPLMAARVTDSIGGALILYKGNKVHLEHIHCQDSNIGLEIRHVFEQVNLQINQTNLLYNQTVNSPSRLSEIVDEKLSQELKPKIQFFGTPILVRNVDQGRLYVFSTDRDYVWTPTRRKLTQLVADQTAVAIANHDLTVELRSKERQDRELEIASEIQLRLLPSKCPEIKGLAIAAKCETASRVGGDYYDFIRTDYDLIESSQLEATSDVPWSIVIGDVMGKGVPAGLIMTMTRGMLRAEVLNRHSPAQIMRHLNRVMYADLENSHRFVSMFYSEYDPQKQTLCFTNAAHNPPLMWRKATNALEKLDSWGMLIGLDMESEYEDATVQLAPGDTIIYYTDGFTDAANADGDRFDEENLCLCFKWACQHLETPDEILNHIFDQVKRFSGVNSRGGDDMTSIVMQIQAIE
ncbi:GAF domain-containing SpoIIE family protein phosphatase [Pleurocapsa sp. FMAR1]|uniref:GAF domain-containing SpoIIE family protein phosphatase n=1 Tax=Pleurocapsa sp. FMAR1 TaxID=3040204 RepID=UPI0029C8E865|nr:GAF domain-containing SpoIIE family protein phosphatase [Pleurocapsa sp. FMAR1]